MNPENDEVIDVKIPKGDYIILRELIAERKAVNWVKGWLSSGFAMVAGGAALFTLTFWQEIKRVFT